MAISDTSVGLYNLGMIDTYIPPPVFSATLTKVRDLGLCVNKWESRGRVEGGGTAQARAVRKSLELGWTPNPALFFCYIQETCFRGALISLAA